MKINSWLAYHSSDDTKLLQMQRNRPQFKSFLESQRNDARTGGESEAIIIWSYEASGRNDGDVMPTLQDFFLYHCHSPTSILHCKT
jgi:hypothetical protein